MVKVLNKLGSQDLPLKWVNLDYLPDSKGYKIEIYLKDEHLLSEGLILMFHTLFQNVLEDIRVYNTSWWDFCLDTWDFNSDNHNYELEGKSIESTEYLIMLQKSNIDEGYSGICKCENWDKFLSVILACILTHQAPFSPIFYNEKNDFFFYFHHTGSIGFYFKSENEEISKMLHIAEKNYELR